VPVIARRELEKIMADFGFESTTDEVLVGQDLSGKSALVTGGTSGIGWETARALAAAGEHVVISARDATKADEAIGTLREAVPAGAFDFVVLELASLASVRDAAKDILARFPAINILINNAGVMTTPFGRTADGLRKVRKIAGTIAVAIMKRVQSIVVVSGE